MLPLVYGVCFAVQFAYPWLTFAGPQGHERARGLDRNRLGVLRAQARLSDARRQRWVFAALLVIAFAALGTRTWSGLAAAVLLIAWMLLTRSRVAEGKRTIIAVADEAGVAGPGVWGRYRYRSMRRRRLAIRVLAAGGALASTAVILGVVADGTWAHRAVVALAVAVPVVLLVALVISMAYFPDQTEELIREEGEPDSNREARVADGNPPTLAVSRAARPSKPQGPSYLS